MKGIVFVLILLHVSISVCFSEAGKKALPLEWKLLPPASAKAGSEVPIVLQIRIQEGWHIFGREPGLKGLVGIDLEFLPSEEYTIRQILYPDPKREHFPTFQKELAFYEGDLEVTALLKISPDAANEIPLKGSFRFQACSDETCLLPSRKTVETKILIR